MSHMAQALWTYSADTTCQRRLYWGAKILRIECPMWFEFVAQRSSFSEPLHSFMKASLKRLQREWMMMMVMMCVQYLVWAYCKCDSCLWVKPCGAWRPVCCGQQTGNTQANGHVWDMFDVCDAFCHSPHFPQSRLWSESGPLIHNMFLASVWPDPLLCFDLFWLFCLYFLNSYKWLMIFHILLLSTYFIYF